MLSKDVFKQQVEKLLIFYPNWGIKTEDPTVMRAWYDLFSELTDEEFCKAVNEHILKEKFNPTASSISYHKPTVQPNKAPIGEPIVKYR